LYKLWGAARDKVLAYASAFELGTPKDRAEQAQRYLSEGFKALKIRLHADTVQEDLAYVDEIKKAIGDKMKIMVDANQPTDNVLSFTSGPKWDYKRALTTALELQDRGVVWLEEPLGRWQFNDLAALLEKMTSLYIAGGEGNTPLHEFLWIMEKHALDIVQPDAVYESLTQVRKIMALCEAFNVHFVPHHGLCGIGLAATLHLLCTYSGWTWAEYMYDPPYRTIENYQCLGGIITTPLKIDAEGCLSPSPLPGLGIEIDMDRVKQYSV
ncbi:MAG: hypothetical protein LBR61_03145, partial [Synergistaceae bacterium]|nr:hypothetical protein [Synergistaceae bacterium]